MLFTFAYRVAGWFDDFVKLPVSTQLLIQGVTVLIIAIIKNDEFWYTACFIFIVGALLAKKLEDIEARLD